MNRLWDDERIGSELDKVAFWCGPGDPEMVAVYDAKVIMRRMRDEYEAAFAATWQPVEQAEIACDCGECDRVIVVEEDCLQIDGPDGMLTAHLPDDVRLCRRVGE